MEKKELCIEIYFTPLDKKFISYNKPTPLPRKKKPEIQKSTEPSDDGQSIYSENSFEDIVVTGPEDNIPPNIVKFAHVN